MKDFEGLKIDNKKVSEIKLVNDQKIHKVKVGLKNK